MTQEEAGVLLAENTWLRAEVGLLQRANADLQQQLQTALEQIKKLEGSKSAPVRQLYEEAQKWLREQPTPTAKERRRQYQGLITQLCALGEPYATAAAHPCATLAKRLLRHQEELFQFVLLPEVPADNNLAERSIRPLVIMRKISGGSRSEKGTQTRLALASLFHTWTARDLNPFHTCLAALQRPTATSPP